MAYKTDKDFRKALEERLRQRAQQESEPLIRLRKRVVFERCMVRLQHGSTTPWVLKDGFALELRLGNLARMTNDLDLTADVGYFEERGADAGSLLVDRLREDLARENEDRFAFRVAKDSDAELPTQGVKTFRYLLDARLDGRRFESIKIDIGIGDPLIQPTEEIEGSDLLSFAGISAAIIRATSGAQHFAEKLHALTKPWGDRLNTRVKDLADLMLMIEHHPPQPPDLRVAVTEIFAIRNTHPIPSTIETVPANWATSYSNMATQLNLAETTLAAATNRLNAFWKSVFEESSSS